MFEYAPRPTCQMGPNCGSKLLFCDRSHGQPHCAAKVRPGGNCTGFINGEDVCLNGICQNGQCRQTNNNDNTPTPMPPSPATTEKPIRPVQSCYNEHECCSVWAQKGECQQNQGYMHAWCKASCQQCQPDYDLYQECNNRHPNCQTWTSQGQCQRNKFWMAENCRQSCGKCRVSRQQVCSGGQDSQQNRDRITLAPPASKCASRSCFNENICCQLWGLAGECRRNPTWMNCFCRVSCGRCVPQDYDFGGCADYSQRCRYWGQLGRMCRNALDVGELYGGVAAHVHQRQCRRHQQQLKNQLDQCSANPTTTFIKGQCQRNQFWMAENCRQSCGKCRVSRQQVCNGGQGSQQNRDRITLAPPASKCASRSCFNENICCQLWGLAGECRRNPTWMNCFCRVSCGRCVPQDYDFGGCADYSQRCRYWANSGECGRNAWMLENCRWSCGTCVGFWELRQLCRMGGNGRGKRAADGMPAIDFANMDMSSLISRFVREVNRNRTNEEGDGFGPPVHGIPVVGGGASDAVRSAGPPSDSFAES
uniref:ShKT domain-containing protein n=1 Tax=Globodera pallida TaxID=36090 RepID=A0A183C0M7_GLOPA